MPQAISGKVRLAQLALLYCAAIWGSTFFVVRDAVTQVEPSLLVGLRFTWAAVLLSPLAFWRAWRFRTAPVQPGSGQGWRAGLGLGLILWVLYATQTAGLVYTTAANSGFITGLFIVFVPLLGWLLLREVPRPQQLLAVGVAVGGLALLTGGLSELNRGDALTLFAAMTYALHVLLTDRYARRGHDPYILCFVQMLITGLLGLALAWLEGVAITVPAQPALGQILFLTLFPSITAFTLQVWAQRHVPAVQVALIFTLEPVFGALFAWTVGGEQFIALRACGGLLIVGAMLLSELPPRLEADQCALQ